MDRELSPAGTGSEGGGVPIGDDGSAVEVATIGP